MLRFIRKLKKEKISGILTAHELDQAKTSMVKVIQNTCYSEIKLAIKEKKRNNLVTQLGLVLDPDELIRCTGRLGKAQLTEAARRPILLPKKNKITELIIEEKHKTLFHAGVSQTLSTVRQVYWIPQGRSEVHRILRKCTACKRYEGGPYRMPLMPPMPHKRVNESPPFTYTGVDYFGPLNVKTDIGNKKVWICLYTCLVIRAVHLEIMQDMSAEEFLLGFRRFIARWGKPKQIISDNGSQFKLAGKVIEQIWHETVDDPNVQTYISNEGIQWQYIVELAPWMGGFYERLVGVVKRGLRKTIGKLRLNNDQLRTIIAKSESVVNSRPLVYVGEDINSTLTLTPAHFLTLNPITGIPETDENEMDDPNYLPQITSSKKLLSTWKKGQKHLNTFWKVWRDEYLLSLSERTASKLKGSRISSNEAARVGDVVLIKDDLPRGSWKIGRIKTLFESRDGEVRSCRVMLPNKKVLNRALNMLYPLECEDNHDEDEIKDGDEESIQKDDITDEQDKHQRPKRKAAQKAIEKMKDM